MLYRKKIEDFKRWKENNSTALLVDGARQVGKTKLIEEFIKNEFNNYIEIDLSKNSIALGYLLEIKDYDELVSRLSLISNTKLSGENDVLFLDEIQYYYEIREKRIKEDPSFAYKYSDIITLSKEIVSRHEFRLIMSGSMFGVSLFNINLNPTGYVTTLTLYPMDFEEFLIANKINENIIKELKDCFNNKTSVSDTLNEMMIKKYEEYTLLGGMPKAVDAYLNDKNFINADLAIQEIDYWYRKDILKYTEKSDRLIILEMYDLLPSEISMKNRRFVKSHMDISNFKNLNLDDRFLWLKKVGIAIPTYNVTNPKCPLLISKDHKTVKLFFNDVGLLTHYLFDSEAKMRLLINRDNIDFGAIYENVVAETLLTHGYNPFFYSNKKRGEVDFIIEKDMAIIPIEIKSYKLKKNIKSYSHPALDNLLEAHKEIKESWVFGLTNVYQERDRIYCFPIYMIDFIKK